METLDYLKDRYAEELSRFNHFETKCSKFLTFITGIIGGMTAFASFTKETLLMPETPIGWIQLLLFCLSLFIAICAWGHSLLALRIGKCPILPKSKVAASYINRVSETERIEYIYECYVDTLELLTEEIDKKSHNLELAYSELTMSAWGLGILGFLTIFVETAK
ncbi:hypothetical protein [Neptunicella marina]|uniref:Uncharacterized protein n=1 Tax=Neptunicella marina TaxID=2125989 RepID=A0A8J6IWB2_9ALTE|nr:hypothetical protein [Neptunicella marina]MBC3767284.1 hypothetical protein [Neptunicella marina]